MKKLILTLALFVSLTATAQNKPLTGANGFIFSSSKQAVTALIAKKGWKTMPSSNKTKVFVSDITVSSLPVEFGSFSFHKDKLFMIVYKFDYEDKSSLLKFLMEKYGIPDIEPDTKDDLQFTFWNFDNKRDITFIVDYAAKNCSLSYTDNILAEKKETDELSKAKNEL